MKFARTFIVVVLVVGAVTPRVHLVSLWFTNEKLFLDQIHYEISCKVMAI